VLNLFQGQMRLQVRMERQNLGADLLVGRLERLLRFCRGPGGAAL
jgi:hypothetical protein